MHPSDGWLPLLVGFVLPLIVVIGIVIFSFRTVVNAVLKGIDRAKR